MRHPKFDPTSKEHKEGMKKLMDGFGLNSAESIPVTDNSKVNMNMMQQIEQLQTKLAESEARVERLRVHAEIAVQRMAEEVIPYADVLSRIVKQTPAQSLSEHDVEVVEKAKVSSQMKADCMGEISFVIENGNCCPQCWHEQDDDCDICHGESGENGSSNLTVQVPWDTMKDIWKMMNESYARELRQQQTNGE
ncbi:MAG: hypothetical protein Tp185DCM00d2C31949971_12 [Prokaryotic dsDNA virus sp.]|uniref:hypothetical protein n=1 Tax=Gammaproteobacteria TaxID=1236 RepID=UPI000C543F5C|nr:MULTISPECIES: hypothetical protein [Gammaproteobacteria]MBP58948.1 hypothetical protein [Idiomarina sp.]QDP60896.1 MAG: hypothetical protein Tp185DCM00d2C31949971_12 [Prokaryotic dsDNA virus sp.]QDP61769.1 MAG: hypothetical protein Tp1111MES1053591_8 [Prokaryotic dsDNA virus sp.]HCC80425.1 hypothetical protein [Methylophaga sp.]|tara:strand:+ start:4920 stop:5498 length:579 start_codon:yes stop_codon:yes gene_type:complete